MKKLPNVKNVLIVDDSHACAQVACKTVKNLGIAEVSSVNNGFDALNVAIKNQPDIIFLDVEMPEIDGLQTLKMLKRVDYTKDINVVMVAASHDVKHFATAVKFGAVDYVMKPFTMDTVREKIVQLYPLPSEVDDLNNENAF